MEQMTFSDLRPNVERIREAIIQEISNKDYTKHLSVSENKDGSISVKAKSIIVAKIVLRKSVHRIQVKPKYDLNFPENRITRHSEEWSYVEIIDIDDAVSLSIPMATVYMTMLSEMGGERFGCCYRYEQCSDAKKCLHPDFLISRACAYRRNLESGRIFYGKNKNI